MNQQKLPNVSVFGRLLTIAMVKLWRLLCASKLDFHSMLVDFTFVYIPHFELCTIVLCFNLCCISPGHIYPVYAVTTYCLKVFFSASYSLFNKSTLQGRHV